MLPCYTKQGFEDINKNLEMEDYVGGPYMQSQGEEKEAVCSQKERGE